MTPEQKILVQASFKKVVPIAEQAASLFYARLFEIAPEVRSLFKGDMHQQGIKLFQVLSFAVCSLDKIDEVTTTVRDLGKRHIHYGVQLYHFALVGEALIWALEQGLQEDFTPEVKEAWTLVYTILSDTMKEAVLVS